MFVTKVCFLLASVAILTVNAAFNLPGECPDFHFTNGVDIGKLKGEWHIIQYAKNGLEMKEQLCQIVSINATENGGMETIVTSIIEGKVVPAHWKFDPSANQPGKFELKHPGRPTFYVNYIDTDITNYAVLILCTSDGAGNYGYFIELISRRNTLEPEFIEKGKAALKAANIPEALMDTSC